MKIIASTNHNNELLSDILICENINNEHRHGGFKTLAESIVNYLNSLKGNTYYYKAAPDDYPLYKFEPEEKKT